MSQSWIVASMTRQRDRFAFSHLALLAFSQVVIRDVGRRRTEQVLTGWLLRGRFL